MLRLILILGLVCLIAASVLGATYHFTAPLIARQEAEEEDEALKSVIEDADDFKPKEIGAIKYYEAYKKGRLLGYCVLVKSPGYSAEIKMMVGIDKEGVIKGIEVLSHEETPGLGSQIAEVRPEEKGPWFLRQFNGKSATTLESSDIDAITGATISSNAVVDGVKRGVSEFLERIR